MKIKISESKLKQIVAESVKSVLNEASYDRMGNFNSDEHNSDIVNNVSESVSKLLRAMDKSIFSVGNNRLAATDEDLKGRLFALYRVLNGAHEAISNALNEFKA